MFSTSGINRAPSQRMPGPYTMSRQSHSSFCAKEYDNGLMVDYDQLSPRQSSWAIVGMTSSSDSKLGIRMSPLLSAFQTRATTFVPPMSKRKQVFIQGLTPQLHVMNINSHLTPFAKNCDKGKFMAYNMISPKESSWANARKGSSSTNKLGDYTLPLFSQSRSKAHGTNLDAVFVPPPSDHGRNLIHGLTPYSQCICQRQNDSTGKPPQILMHCSTPVRLKPDFAIYEHLIPKVDSAVYSPDRVSSSPSPLASASNTLATEVHECYHSAEDQRDLVQKSAGSLSGKSAHSPSTACRLANAVNLDQNDNPQRDTSIAEVAAKEIITHEAIHEPIKDCLEPIHTSFHFPTQKELDEAGTVRGKNSVKTWYKQFRQLLLFREEFKHCNVPQKYSLNPRLGIWVNKQRSCRARLSKEKVAALEAAGFEWAKKKSEAWENMFRELVAFYKIHGHSRVGTKRTKLGLWRSRQRVNRNLLSESRKKKLEDLGVFN